MLCCSTACVTDGEVMLLGQVLELMGGELARLSAAQKGLYDPNIMGGTENRDSDAS
jgi:hypothetical protein